MGQSPSLGASIVVEALAGWKEAGRSKAIVSLSAQSGRLLKMAVSPLRDRKRGFAGCATCLPDHSVPGSRCSRSSRASRAMATTWTIGSTSSSSNVSISCVNVAIALLGR